MIHYTNDQLASIIALPIVSILLVWTVAIFQKNRKKWGPYDIPIVSILILSILRNFTILTYTLFVTLNQNTIDIDYCSGIIWIFNSIHTFQACSLTTLAIIGLFSIKLRQNQQHIRQFLTSTHLIYHFFCLTTLCACVGVAALLARNDRHLQFVNVTIFDSNPCKFMPFDLDIKYNVFIIVLNTFLAIVSLVAFFGICLQHYKYTKRQTGIHFDYLQKSSSDLSDLSVQNQQKNYYDTYTIQRRNNNVEFYDGNNQPTVACIWNSDVSNTVSSTNSRRPCLMSNTSSLRNQKKGEENRTGLETIHPVLIVCYLFYHLPLIALCIHPQMIAPWPIAGIALWLGLVQDLLIPIGLSIVDQRFCKWVSNVYKCNDKHGTDKLPHVGLDGKFRTFGGGSPPQSLDVEKHLRVQTVEHRFPITNGSLYTSIDGRLPIIHNYRRHNNKEQKSSKPENGLNHQVTNLYDCRNCAADLCPSHSNLHHLSPHYKQLNLPVVNFNVPSSNAHKSQSQENIRFNDLNFTLYQQQSSNPELIIKNSRNLVRLNKMRLCKSEDSLADIVQRTANCIESDSSEDDYGETGRSFDTLSSQSSFSITTEANCDFEFYQENNQPKVQPPPPPMIHHHHHEKRQSLENLNWYNHHYEVITPRIQRSNSFMTADDREKARNRALVRSSSKRSDCTPHQHYHHENKVKSVELLPNRVCFEDVFYFNYPNRNRNEPISNRPKMRTSVPDLKKIFISEYI